jgi:hypothetical protein
LSGLQVVCKHLSVRWRFPGSNDLAEARERERVLGTIDAWWRTFSASTANFNAGFVGTSSFDIGAFMHEHLQCIDERLMWEFAPALRADGHRLVVTPESERQLRPLVDALLLRAPPISGWEFYGYRQAAKYELALANALGRSGVDVSGFGVEATRGELNAIDLVWTLPHGTEPNDQVHGAALVATESLLGEEILDTWIGDISIRPQARPSVVARMIGRSGAQALPGTEQISTLQERVRSLISSVRAELPDDAFVTLDDDGKGTLFELKPKQAEDYPRQLDLFVSSSRRHPTMWLAAHAPFPFSSQRFSKHGEVFCYLKIDGVKGLDGSAYSDRSQLEDAIDESLRPRRLGSVVGGGTGLRYSYVDLALPLRDIDEGLSALRTLCQEGKIPNRSWLLFFDAAWQEEWVGIYDDTPPPP